MSVQLQQTNIQNDDILIMMVRMQKEYNSISI